MPCLGPVRTARPSSDRGNDVTARRGKQRVMVLTATGSRRGAEIQGTQLARQLGLRGFPVSVRSLHRGSGSPLAGVTSLGHSALGLKTLSALRTLAKAADVVVAYGSRTLPACAMALQGVKTPFIYRSIGDPDYWVRGELHRALTGLQYRQASTVVALWQGAAGAISRLYSVPADRVLCIPNARPASNHSPVTAETRQRARSQLGVGPEPIAVFVGSLSPEKRIDRAIRAISLTARHHLLVAGLGPDLHSAKTLASTVAPGRVRFLGHLEDVQPLLRAADALLISSDTEGMPGAAIEAMLTGVPVVATRVGALPEMGVTLADSTPQALASTLESGRAIPVSSEDASRFTWDEVAPQWVRLLKRVTG